MEINKSYKIVDLFAGIGGMRKGFEIACKEHNVPCECVFTSEIKKSAIQVLKQNYPNEIIYGDITQIDENEIPDFDVLLAGFPCQPFSSAGKKLGFEDTRGTLFFEIARILKAKKPSAFILENVEGLVKHDRDDKTKPIGKTLDTILNTLVSIGYKVTWKVLNAKDFGIPQDRKRVYIIGTRNNYVDLSFEETNEKVLKDILEQGLPTENSDLINKLLSHYSLEDLQGKSIKDKRGGSSNIHSWDIEYRGPISQKEKDLMNALLTERRKKQWADVYGIDWMDGMPLTEKMIESFYPDKNLHEMLKHLTELKYLVYEYPKKKVGNRREYDSSLPKGYNIVSGKLSFEVNKILNPNKVSPTLVAMDMQHLFVTDKTGLRHLTLTEGLRLFGYPDDFKFQINVKDGYDLLGNTVVVPVIKEISERILINI